MLKKSRVVKVPKYVADNFMQEFEHLGNVGLGVWHWGLELNKSLASVVSYGTTCFSPKRGWLGHISREAGCGIIQLCRGGSAPWSPRGTASRLICLANREMYRLRGPLMIVAYANQDLYEIGTIYQACNAIYTGQTDPKGQANYIINGRMLTGWQARKLYGTRNRDRLSQVDKNMRVLPLSKKHRYIMLAGSRSKKRLLNKLIKPFALPYPKRKI